MLVKGAQEMTRKYVYFTVHLNETYLTRSYHLQFGHEMMVQGLIDTISMVVEWGSKIHIVPHWGLDKMAGILQIDGISTFMIVKEKFCILFHSSLHYNTKGPVPNNWWGCG